MEKSKSLTKAITAEKCQHILTNVYREEDINEAVHKLWKVDPGATVTEGEFKGINSLMLYCILSRRVHLLLETVNINLEKLYKNIINHPNLDINATCTGEGPDKGKSVLWLAAKNYEWDLADKLIDMRADINATCTGEGPDKGKSVLWLTADNYKWNLADKLIEMGADINATSIAGDDKGRSVLWLAAASNDKWDLVEKLIDMGADINATCTGEGFYKGTSVLRMIQGYHYKNDIFYRILFIMGLQSRCFEYSEDVILTNKIKEIKDKVNYYIKAFIPSTDFKEDNYYKKNYLNDLPEEIRKLIAAEYIKNDLVAYNISADYIEYCSNKIADNLFKCLSEELIQAQTDLEKQPYLYELVLFSGILTTLRDNTKMLDTITQNGMNKNKKSINEVIFKHQFLPAFEQAKLKGARITTMNVVQRLELYEFAKQYGNGVLTQKPKENTLTQDDFSAIFSSFS